MESSQQQARGLTFGSVAESYERYRLGYPSDLVDRVLQHATRPVRTAVEIGAGTGKATRVFAEAGVRVTAVEPDAAMLDELQRRVRGDVVPVFGTFEGAHLPGQYDLVYAAAALHWTDPATRWSRIAALLPAGGVVASFGGPRHIADPALRDEVRRVREPYIDDDDVYSPGVTTSGADLQWPGTEMAASPWFVDVRRELVERVVTLSAEDYIGHLSTVSAYLVLPEGRRHEVLTRIRSVLPERVDLIADLTLHLGRRSETPR